MKALRSWRHSALHATCHKKHEKPYYIKVFVYFKLQGCMETNLDIWVHHSIQIAHQDQSYSTKPLHGLLRRDYDSNPQPTLYPGQGTAESCHSCEIKTNFISKSKDA